jgi:hypothetical protein
MNRAPLALLLASILLCVPAPTARADDRLPGEAGELTPAVRTQAQAHLDVLVKGGPEGLKARRALLVLGPSVWPVVENTLRLAPSTESRAHLHFLKALLAKKAEPELETLRGRLRRKALMDDMAGVLREVNEFRAGRPDPNHKGVRIPPQVPSKLEGKTTIFRSSDGSLVLAFGGDGTAKEPDAPIVSVSDPIAGLVVAVGGKAMPFARRSGNGSEITVGAPNGFAWAYASDGAAGQAPGGLGGEGGTAQAQGGAGQWSRSGTVGVTAPDPKK